jgi:hypothetical protein
MRINNSNSSYKNDAISNAENREDFNPYTQFGSKKSEQSSSSPSRAVQDNVAPALVPPELIKVEIPHRMVYDFTKKSYNSKLLEDGVYDRFIFEDRCDSKIEEGDLEKLQIELKKKQRRRNRAEQRDQEERERQ